MQVPLQITYRDVSRMDDLDALIERLVRRLERGCDHVDSCRVAIERQHTGHREHPEFRVRIDLMVPPGHEVVVSRETTDPSNPRELRALVRDAFTAARRRVSKLGSKQGGVVKKHPDQEVTGVVRKLMDGFGFVETSDGREIYFHAHSVLSPGFEALRVGNGVTFAEELGEQGPQASTVRVIDHRGANATPAAAELS